MRLLSRKFISTTSLVATLSLGLGLGLALTPQAAFAGNGNFGRNITSFTDYAKVISVEPVYRRVAVNKPVRECWIEQREHTTVYENHDRNRNDSRGHNSGHNSGQAVIGGLIGGAIGNQIGRHTGSRQGRVGATVAGAILGSVIANESPRRHRNRRHNSHGNNHGSHTVTESQPVERCTTRVEKQYRKDFKGYDVTYRYRGHNHTTRMQHDPGSRIPVQVNVSPVDQNG